MIFQKSFNRITLLCGFYQVFNWFLICASMFEKYSQAFEGKYMCVEREKSTKKVDA